MSTPESVDPLARLAATEQLAAGQHGAFTVRQAYDMGWTKGAVDRRRRTGAWVSPVAGALAMAEPWAAMKPEARHLCAAHARILLLQRGWHASRLTAALAHELPLLNELPARPQLVRQPARATDRASFRNERLAELPGVDTCLLRGLPTTSLARTVVDLARTGSLRDAVVAGDAALRRGMQAADLLAVVARCAGWPGARTSVLLPALTDGRSESALESLSRVAFHECGIPLPEPQVEIHLDEHCLARVDYLWRAHNVIGEADGRMKYVDAETHYREKRREQLLRDLGFEVVRWGWADAMSPRPRMDVAIRRALARGLLNTLDPRVRRVSTVVPVCA